MSNFSSKIQILTIEKTPGKTKEGKEFERVAARCILLSDAGEVVTVGRLRVPPSLVDQAIPGTYSAAFSLGVPDWGDSKGDIVAQLVGLQPVTPVRPAAKPASPAAPVAA